MTAMAELWEQVVSGDVRAAARAMRNIDDHAPGYLDLLKRIFPHTGRAFVLGITGNPGAGKSTLTDRLIECFRKEERKVGVICVDPTSPYTGGAILGDRIRMTRHACDPGVFIRSVATRGHLGGLSSSARDMVRVLDAFGCDVVMVETVGVGQDELEITRTAHSTLVVMAPGMGDEVQAIKAGILETADVFAVNKADRDGADGTVRDLELMISLGGEALIALGKSKGHVVHGRDAATAHTTPDEEHWTPPIHKCVATRGEGLLPIVASVEAHRAWLANTPAGRARRLLRLSEEVREALREALIATATRSLADKLDDAVMRVEQKLTDPYTAIEELVAAFVG